MKRTCALIAVFLAVINLAVIIATWYASSGSLTAEPWATGAPAIAWGRLAGLLLHAALLVQLLLIGRIACIEQSFGFDGLNRLHRWLGYSLIALLILHPALLSIGYAPLREQSTTQTFVGIVTGFDDVMPALIGTILLFGVIAVSVPWVRRRLRYETWHAAHLVTYLAIWLAFEHQVEIGGDFVNRSFVSYWYALTGAAVGIFFLYRFLRPFALWYRHRFVVDYIIRESPGVWSVHITGRSLSSFRFEPGQYANLYLRARGLWSGHPFSFSREYDGNSVRFSIKELGDATSLITKLKPGTPVIIDGPLGVFTPNRARTDQFLLIGGGIGITPLRAIAGALARRRADVVVLYGVRTAEHAALLGELRSLAIPTHLFVSQGGPSVGPEVRVGHIDAAAIRELVPDVRSRDVYLCGPAPMMDALTAAVRSLGVPSGQIHAERFGY